jgi:HK97 family phage prohead protease
MDHAELRREIAALARADATHNEARAELLRRAATAGARGLIPDNWAEDGTLRDGRAWPSERRDTYNDLRQALASAIADTLAPPDTGDLYVWVQDFTDEWAVYEYQGDLLQVPYTQDDAGTITLGEPVKVRQVTTYVERSSDATLEFRQQRAAMLEGAREIRHFDASEIEVRDTSDGMVRFSGYASVTEHPYEVADFVEVISRGAFRRTLNEEPDVVLLINHGEGGGLPLARTKSGTLTLSEDARGLRVNADLNPQDPDVQALVPKLRRGDVSEMSFAFRATDQEWSSDYGHRTIRSVAMHKGDVSIVTHGANPEAGGGLAMAARSSDGTLELRAGKAFSASNMEALTGVLNKLADADDSLDDAIESLSTTLGVPNPDADEAPESAADEKDEQDAAAARAVVIPDYTTRAAQEMALLRRGR